MVYIFIGYKLENKDYLSLVATDGHRLAKFDFEFKI